MRPASPFATRGEDLQVLGLDDAVRDLGRHHLLGMGYGLLGMGYLGPRHAIRGGAPEDHAALLSWHGTVRSAARGAHVLVLHVVLHTCFATNEKSVGYFPSSRSRSLAGITGRLPEEGCSAERRGYLQYSMES